MATINIWGSYRGNVEKIDTASTQREADELVREYRRAYGRDWAIWAGRKSGN